MKYLIIAAFLTFSVEACTNSNHPIRTVRMNDDNTAMKIEDDGKTMSIEVRTKNTESPINYDKSFDVTNMDNEQKRQLENRILDSLGIEKPK